MPGTCTWPSPIPPRSSTCSSPGAWRPVSGTWTRMNSWTSAARAGAATDAKTLTCLLWLQNVRGGHWELDWHPNPDPDRHVAG